MSTNAQITATVKFMSFLSKRVCEQFTISLAQDRRAFLWSVTRGDLFLLLDCLCELLRRDIAHELAPASSLHDPNGLAESGLPSLNLGNGGGLGGEGGHLALEIHCESFLFGLLILF